MNQEQKIEEGNRLIAEFMGCYGSTMWAGGEEVYRYGFKETHITDRWHESQFNDRTPYHTSWDWLLSPIKKFNDLNIHDASIRKEWLTVTGEKGSGIGKLYVAFCDKIDSEVVREYNINHAWDALVEAITWYNTALPTGTVTGKG